MADFAMAANQARPMKSRSTTSGGSELGCQIKTPLLNQPLGVLIVGIVHAGKLFKATAVALQTPSDVAC
jgi:hypothetical protein